MFSTRDRNLERNFPECTCGRAVVHHLSSSWDAATVALVITQISINRNRRRRRCRRRLLAVPLSHQGATPCLCRPCRRRCSFQQRQLHRASFILLHPRCVHCQTTTIIRTIIPHPLEPFFLCAAGNCQPSSSTPKPTSCSLALADILHPQAKLQLHALIVPKRHIVSVLDLTPSDLPLLHSLQDLGNQLLVWFGIPNNARTHARARMVFHVPPFHSVSHLHLHVHSSDEGLTWTGRIKYWTETKWCCCTSWESVVKRLEGATTLRCQPNDADSGRTSTHGFR
jgi:Scavenger mRNA decapping enzyme C-term binding